MTRLKKVFTNNEIGHIWANNTDPNRSGRASNNSFNGFEAFSYGHYLIAVKTGKYDVNPESRKEIVLIQENKYSMTTAQHISRYVHALDKTRFYIIRVPSLKASSFAPGPDHDKNKAWFMAQAQDLCNKTIKALKNGAWYMEQLAGITEDYKVYCQAYGFKPSKRFPCLTDAQALKVQDRAQRWEATQKARERAREERQKVLNLEHLEAWRRGEWIPYGASLHYFPVELRLKDNMIETSYGARVPLLDGIKAIAQYQAGTLEHGQVIGQYKFDRITEAGAVKIGCHVISKEEIERFTALLEAKR